MSVVFDLGAGQARLGATVVPIASAGRNGELRVGGRRGPVLRPLAFGERTRVVAGARHAADARDAVASAVAAAALVQRGRLDARVQDVVALALAGAEETAPPFGETALLVARAAGWDYARLMEADAAEVDRLARQLGGRPPRPGWTRFVLGGDAAGELDAMRRDLAQALLERSEESPIDLEDAVGVPEAPPSPARDGDGWAFPSRTVASGAAGVEWPPSAPLAGPPPRPRGHAPEALPAAAGAEAGPRAEGPGQTPATSAADTSARARSGVRPWTRPVETRPAEPRPGSDPRLPAFRFDGTSAAETPPGARRRSSSLFAQVPMRAAAAQRPAVSESARSVSAAPVPSGPAATPVPVAPDPALRSGGMARANTSALRSGTAASALAAEPVESAPTAWGAPDPTLPLVPARAQPFVLAPLTARPLPERTALDPRAARVHETAPRRADDVAELLAAALDDECDLRGIAR